jgi:hypothetical protein
LTVLPNLFEQKQANKKSSTPVRGFVLFASHSRDQRS